MSDRAVVPTPVPGTIVLYAPHKTFPDVRAATQPGAEDPEIEVFPAIVVRHLGDGLVQLGVVGFTGLFSAAYGEVAPGRPQVTCWCYAVKDDTTIALPDALA